MPLLANPVKYSSNQYKSDRYKSSSYKHYNANHNTRMHIICKIRIAPLIQFGNHFGCIATIFPTVYEHIVETILVISWFIKRIYSVCIIQIKQNVHVQIPNAMVCFWRAVCSLPFISASIFRFTRLTFSLTRLSKESFNVFACARIFLASSVFATASLKGFWAFSFSVCNFRFFY